MEKYKRAFIFVIRNNFNKKVLVNYSTDDLETEYKRVLTNLTVYRNKNKLNNDMIKYGTDAFYIEKIEDYPTLTNYQIRQRVDEYIDKFDSIANGYNHRKLCSLNPLYQELHEKELKDIKKLLKYYGHESYIETACRELHNRHSRIREKLYFKLTKAKKDKN